MKQKLKDAYMKTAETFAELSHARRRHVGAVIVKDDNIISFGWNGMPAGWDNNCEFEQTDPQTGQTTLVTREEVLHAESNAIAKLARGPQSGNDADLFVTTAPCIHCAKLIYQSGIKRVWFRDGYRDNSGIDFLKASGLTVTQMEKGQ